MNAKISRLPELLLLFPSSFSHLLKVVNRSFRELNVFYVFDLPKEKVIIISLTLSHGNADDGGSI